MNTILSFFRGVWRHLLESSKHLIRSIGRFEKKSEHVVKRVIEVESRISGFTKRAHFLYRWARSLIKRYHLIPHWLKIAKLVVICVIVFGPGMWESFQREHRQKILYNELFEYYYAHYLEQKHPNETARYYADLYAQQYAEYYTSPAYEEALRYALPEQVPKQEKPKQPTKDATTTPAPDTPAQRPKPDSSPSYHTHTPTLLPIGVELVKHFEGLMLKPYKDSGGKYTIGYGHLIRASERYTRISEKKAEKLLRNDLRIAEAIVRNEVQVPISSYQFSALVSLVYNIGGYHFRKSTLLKKLNRKDYEGAGEEILRWNKVGRKTISGLKRRRMAEHRLFTGKWRTPEA